MSTEIDNHIVQMELQNSQFEENANQTMATLDELKEKLNFDNVSKGFDQLDAASKKVSLFHLSGALDLIASRFTDLGIIGVTALHNIANAAVDAGKTMLKSLTIDPISQGFGEYELKMGSIQTIMAGTGESLTTVAGYLDELNQYADKTIYSFANMTNSIGKFTNAGVPLEQAVAAIKGISNEAALAGATTEQASHAMYNFAQALSSGYVKLIDWKSIEVANMATKDFKQQLIDTAVELGTLVKVGDDYKTTTANATGSVSGLFNATKNFNDNLQYQWMTTDVLVKTLGTYADETTDVGKKATQAATEVKTFNMMMSALKEAVGSGWATTWENIFGDFEEAKELWTRINNVVSGVIDKQSDSRNLFLKTWKDLGGRSAAIEGLANILSRLGDIIKAVSNGFKEIFPAVSAKSVANAFKMFENITKSIKISDKTLENIKQTAKGFFSVFSIGYNVIKPFASALLKLATYIIPSIGSAFLSVTGSIGKVLSSIDTLVKETKIFSSIAKFLESIFGNLFYPVKVLFDAITDGLSSLNSVNMSGVKDALTNVANWLDSASANIDEWFKSAKDTISDFISYVKTLDLGPFKDFVNGVRKVFDTVSDGIKKGLDKAYAYIKDFVASIKSSMTDVGNTDVSGVTKFVDAVKKAFGPFSGIIDFFQSVWDTVQDIYKKVSPKIISIAKAILGELKRLGTAFAEGIRTMDFGSFSDVLNTGLIGLVLVKLKQLAKSISMLSGKKGIAGVLESVKIVFQSLSNTINEFQKSIKSNIILKIAIAIGMLTASIIALSAVDTQSLSDSLGAIIVLMTSLTAATSGISSAAEAKATGALIKLSIAVWLLSKSIADLSEIDPSRLLPTVLAVVVALGALAGAYSLVAVAQTKMARTQIVLARAQAKATPDKMSQSLSALFGTLQNALKIVDKIGTIIAIGEALKALAINIGVLTVAIIVLGNIDDQVFSKGMMGVGSLLIALMAIMMIASRIQFGGAAALIGLSLALTSLMVPIIALQAVKWESIGKGFTVLGGGVLVLASLAWAVSLFWDKTAKKMPEVMKGLIMFGVAILEFSFAMRVIATVPWPTILGSLVAIPALIALIGVAMRAFPDGKDINKVFTSLIKMATAFSLFIGAIALLGLAAPYIYENADYIVRVLQMLIDSACIVITGSAKQLITAVTSLVYTVLESLIKEVPMLVKSLSDFIIAVLDALNKEIPRIVPKAMETLSLLMTEIVSAAQKSPMGLAAIGSIIAITVAFTILFKQLKNLSSSAKDGIKGAAAIALAIVAIGGAISLIAWLGSFSDMGTIVFTTLAMITATITFSRLFDNLAKLSKYVGKAIVGALGLAAVMTIVGTVIGLMSYLGTDVPPDVLFAFAASMSLIMASAAAAIRILGGMNIPAAIAAVGILMFALIGITAVVALLGMYADKVLGPEFEDTFNGAIALMTKLGQSIGGFIGGMYGSMIEGIGDAVIDVLPRVGEALVSLGTSLRTFFDTLSGANPAAIGLALSMVSVIAALTATELIHQLVSFIAEDPVDEFITALGKLAPGLVEFAGKVKDIKKTDIEGAVSVGGMLATLVQAIPTESVFGKLFTGETDYDDFADGMEEIGEGVAGFANAVLGVDFSGVSDAVIAANDIAGFVENFESLVVGGVVGAWSGEVDYTTFGDNIEGVGQGIAKFANAVKDIDKDAVDKGTWAGKTIGGFIDNFDSLKVGGIIQDIFGTTNYTDFIDNLPGMGTAIKAFGDNTADLKEANIDAAVSAGKTITGFAETLQTKGGVIEWFIGEKTSLGEFATDLTLFAAGLGAFGATVSTIEDSKLRNVAYLLSAISSLLTTLDETGLGDFEELSTSLASVGDLGIEEFVNSFSNSYDELYNAIVSYLKAIYDGIAACKPAIENYTTLCIDGIKAKIDAYGPTFESSAQTIVDKFATAIEDPNHHILSKINSLFETVFTGMTDESSEMATRNTSYGATMVTYIGDGAYSMWESLSNQLYNTVSQAMTPLTEEGSEFQKSAKKIGTNTATWITNGVLESSSPVKSSIHDTLTSLARALQEDETVKTPYKSLGSKLLDYIVLGITSNYSAVKDAMGNTVSSVYQDGINTTEALHKGVTRGLPSVSDSGTAMGETMLRSFDRVMEIHSPPRTMIKRGELIPEGTAIGVRKKLKVATDAFDDMANRELNAYDTAVKKRSSQSTETYDEYWDELIKTAKEGVDNYEEGSLDHLTGMGKHQAITQQMSEQGKEDGKAYTDSLGREIQNGTQTVVNSTDDLVLQVIRGEWGNGIDRINRLTAAGYNYREVQNKVNEALGYMSKASAETTAAMAKNNEQALADSFFDPEEIKKQTDTISSAGSDAYSQLAIDSANATASSIESSVNEQFSNITLDSFNVDTNTIASQVSEGFNNANFDMSQYLDFSNIDTDTVLSNMFGGGNIDISQFFNFSNLGSSITSSINTEDLDMTADLKLNPIVDMDALNRQLNGVNLYIPGDTTMGPTPQTKSRRASFGVNDAWNRLATTLNGDRQKVNMSDRVTTDNTAVVSAINDVKTELQSLSDRMSSLEVVLDDRTLVGKMAPKLDRALGARVTRARRGV